MYSRHLKPHPSSIDLIADKCDGYRSLCEMEIWRAFRLIVPSVIAQPMNRISSSDRGNPGTSSTPLTGRSHAEARPKNNCLASDIFGSVFVRSNLTDLQIIR